VKSYLVIDNTPIDYRAVTIGAGLPLKGILSVINISVELGQNGTTKTDFLRKASSPFIWICP